MNVEMGPPAQTPSRAKSNQPTSTCTPSTSNLKTPSQRTISTPGEQLSATPIINFEKIESQKENVQPLQRGRSAHALSKTFSLQRGERQTQLNQQRNQFENLIRIVKSSTPTPEEESELSSVGNGSYLDDPLELWVDYIKWCSDSYPSGQSNESGLVLLLERATREFYKVEKYRNDSRYLRIWNLYADNVEDSNEVHLFLFANEIGTGLATLYEVTAIGYESRQRYDEADATYRLGINRRVENLDRLRRRYSDFKARILQIQSEINSSSSNDSEPSLTYTQALKQAMAQSNRSLLGTKVSGATGRGETKSMSANSIRNLGGLGGLKSGNGSSSSVRNPNGAKLNVFHDGDDERMVTSSSSSKGLPWSNIGTKHSRTVENKQAISKMNGSIVKAKNPSNTTGGAAAAGKKLEVFKDSDDEDEEVDGEGNHQDSSMANLSTSTTTAVDVFKSNSSKALSETDKLRRQPFMNWATDTKLVPDDETRPPISSSTFMNKDSKKRSSSSNPKGKEKDSKRSKTTSAATNTATSSSSKGQEKYAFPLRSLYPGMDVENLKNLDKKSDVKINHPCGEVSIDEIYCLRKGYSVDSEEDPWAYLDEVKKEKKSQRAETKTTSTSPQPPIVKKDRTIKKKRKERLQEMTSRSEFVSDTIRHKMIDPTEGMKRAMEDVQEMFNGGSDDEASSDDDDDESEEEEEQVDQLGRLMLSSNPNRMMDGINGEIPPTPTPMNRGGISNHSAGLPPLLNFRNNDENGGIQATPSRIVLNGNSNVKATPFGSSRQPFGGSSGGLGGIKSTPLRVVSAPLHSNRQEQQAEQQKGGGIPTSKSLSILKDDEEEEEEEDQDRDRDFQMKDRPLNSIQQQAQQAALLSRPSGPARRVLPLDDPRPSGPARRVLPLDDDDEEEESSEDSGPESEDEEDQAENDGEEGGYQHFRALSPITERTENSKWTVAARTPGTKTPASNKTATSSLPIKEEDEDEISQVEKNRHHQKKPSLVRQKLEMDEDEESFESSEGTGVEKDYSTRYAATGFQDRIVPDLTEGLTIASINEDERSCEEEPEPSREEIEVAVPVAQHGSSVSKKNQYQIPNPCCPTSTKVISKIFGELQLPLESSSDFVDLSSKSAQGKLDELKKRATQLAKASRKSTGNVSTSNSRVMNQPWLLEVNKCRFSIREKLGEGGYGAVFLAEDLDGAAPPRKRIIGGVNGDSSFEKDLANLDIDSSALINSDGEVEDDEEMEKKRLVAIKVENPPNKWEFYILGQLRLRLRDSELLDSIISARKFFAYQDESFLMLEYCSQGTLLDVVNSAKDAFGTNVASTSSLQGGNASNSGGVEEHLAVFFIIELLKLVEGLHRSSIIHGDIKIDNCLLRLQDPPIGQTWSNSYTRDGSDGWSSKGLTLIDFGRAIDLNRFPKDQTFVADWETTEMDCNEMREGRPWTYETDYFGIASVAFTLLFGKYLNVTQDKEGKYRINQSLRRYWQIEIWNRFFETLLNSNRQDQQLPITNQLKEIREEMEDWLEVNCNKSGKNLKGQLRKLEKWALK